MRDEYELECDRCGRLGRHAFVQLGDPLNVRPEVLC